jgi:hypothetical protein
MTGPSSKVNAMLWLWANDIRSNAPSVMHAIIAKRKEAVVVVGMVQRHPSNTAALRNIKLAYTDSRAVPTPTDMATKLARNHGVSRALMRLS